MYTFSLYDPAELFSLLAPWVLEVNLRDWKIPWQKGVGGGSGSREERGRKEA